jgi:hypothetical protein
MASVFRFSKMYQPAGHLAVTPMMPGINAIHDKPDF